MRSVQLGAFNNSWYNPGKPYLWQVLWFLAGLPLLRCTLIPSSGFRAALLRAFGARIGTGAVIRPGVRVKYPWLLTAGDHCWIGEDVWIDNLVAVTLGSNVCISQGAYLCTGNHDWSDPTFGLIAKEIHLESGSWVGAKAVLAPGVVVKENAVAAAGSVVYRDIPAGEIHAGNPAGYVRSRRLRDAAPEMVSVL